MKMLDEHNNSAVPSGAQNEEAVKQGRNKKVTVLKYKAKKGYRRKNGHRQPYTRVRVSGINV